MTVNHEQAARLMHRLFHDAVSQGDIDVIHELYHDHFVDRCPGPGQAPGPQGIVDVVRRYRDAIPDLEVIVEDVAVDGDRIATRETWRGTQAAPLLGIVPSGRPFEASRMHFFRIADGLIAEEWTAGDVIAEMRRVGRR